jgi:hypothetical protein
MIAYEKASTRKLDKINIQKVRRKTPLIKSIKSINYSPLNCDLHAVDVGLFNFGKKNHLEKIH